MAQVYCAYCGKSFTRKEHLERHIPSHTNVKPHRCGLCHLSFARRDLLQRHHSTYHEARDPMEPRPGGVPTVAGRTPIACQNCANAKTGCDKRVPCSRCSEKHLQCAPRFARRSSKAAVRAAQASAAFNNNPLRNPHQHQLPQLQTGNQPSFVETEQGGVKTDPSISPSSGLDGVMTMDPRLQEVSPKKNSPPGHSHMGPEEFPSPHSRVDRLDEFMSVGNDFAHSGGGAYPEIYFMPEYNLDLDIYSATLPMTSRADMGIASFPDLSESSASEPMASNSSRASVHTRDTSIDFENHLKGIDIVPGMADDRVDVQEFPVVVAAEAAWPLARCNPSVFSGACPRTAIVHLECLEQKSKQEGTWRSLEKFLEQVDPNASDLATVVPLTSRTRDKMLAITQSFLHKALEIHRGGINVHTKAGYTTSGDFNFIVLPPSKILEYFLRSYVRSLSVYYPLVAAGCVDPNEMIQDNQASTLLVLLMIAQGAAALPMIEAKHLAAGLTETCRISLFDVIEKDVELSADPVALRCALLFTVLGAWSGDKWLMDIAMGQRAMYLTMLKHAGMMEPQASMIPNMDNSTNIELHWHNWMHREAQNRLVYNWVMLDQELSLFYDTAPILSINELQCPLPGEEVLWMSPNSEVWHSTMQSIYAFTPNVNPVAPSLLDFFQEFIHDNLSGRRNNLTPQQLRLLLHPLQSMLFHLRQMLSCFPEVLPPRRPAAGTVTKATTMQRLEEVQSLLQKWYDLTMNFEKANPGCPVTRCNLVLYHLVALNAVTNFPEIERLARRDRFDGSYWELSHRRNRCIIQREEAVLHCGQVFKLLRLMPDQYRPNWWAAAAYRATLVLWAESVSRVDPSYQTEKTNVTNGTSGSPSSGGLVPVDQVSPGDPAAMAYVWSRDGVAVLTQPDKTTMGLDKPADVLNYGIRSLDEAVSSRIVDGIRRKLIQLDKYWDVHLRTNSTLGNSAAA